MDLFYQQASTTLKNIQKKNKKRISDNVKDDLTALIDKLKSVEQSQRDVETQFDALNNKDHHLWTQMNEETRLMGINWTLVSPFQPARTDRYLKRIGMQIQDMFSQAVVGNPGETQDNPPKSKKTRSKEGGKDVALELAKMTKAIQSALEILHDTEGSKKETVPETPETDMASELVKEVGTISSKLKTMQNTTSEFENASRRLEQMANLARMQNENYNEHEKSAFKTNRNVPCLHTILDEIEELIMKQSREIQMRNHKVNEVGPDLQKTQSSLKAALTKIDSLQTRLTAFASASHTNNNPTVADLSDPNRPTNLQERFWILYTDVRFDAFEKLYKQWPMESDVAKYLLKIFKDVFDYCRDKREIQKRVLHGIIFHPNRDVASYHDQDVNILKNDVFDRHLSDAVKFSGEMAAENVALAYFETKANETDVGNRIPMLETYVKECAKLCWLTQVQTPPVYIDFSAKPGEKFNKATYMEYKDTGKVIDFVVWPPIFLHENGPLLEMGRAQGM